MDEETTGQQKLASARTVDSDFWEHYALAGLVVDERLRVLLVRSGASPYICADEPNRTAHLREEFVPVVSSAISALDREGGVVVNQSVPLPPDRRINLQVCCLDTDASIGADLYFVLVDDSAATADARFPPDQDASSRTRHCMRQIIEEGTAAIRELKPDKEPISNTVSRLQAALAEAETSTEATEPADDDLVGRFRDHDRARAEMTRLTDGSHDFVANADMPLLHLTAEGKIASFTPAAAELLQLQDEDRGRHIAELHLPFRLPDLQPLIQQLSYSGREITQQIYSEDGKAFLLRMRPYRTANQAIDGALIALVDTDDIKPSRESLQKQHAIWSAVAHAATSLLVVITDYAGRIVVFNKAFQQLTGYSEEEAIGMPAVDFLAPRDKAGQMAEMFEQARAGARDMPREIHVATKDGQLRLIAISGAAVGGENGSDGYLIGTGVDITELMRAREKARESQAIASALMETAAQAIVAVDIQGTIVLCNATAEAMFGYSRPELLRLRVEDLMPSQYRGEHVRHRDRYFAQPRNRSIADGLDLKALRKDGTEFSVEISLSIAAINGKSLAVAFISDVTERKRTEAALRRSEEYFRALADRSHDNIAVFDADGTVRYVSASIYRILAGKAEDWVGRQFSWERIHPADRKLTRESVAHVSATPGAAAVVAYRMRHKDGSWRHIESVVQNLLDNPAVCGIVANSRDITEQKQAEEALRESEAAARASKEKLRELTTHLVEAQEEERRRVSKELHDDLLQQIGLLGLELGRIEQDLSPRSVRTRVKLQSAIARVNGLIDEVRRTAYQLHPSVLELLGLADALESLCYDVSAQDQVAVSFETLNVPEGIPRPVALGLYRIAQECLRNVLSHSCASSATVRLEGTEGAVRLQVEDNGSGFESTTAARPGLGFISMEERARAMNGTFSIESTPNRGTRVDVRVPLSAREAAE